MAFTVGVPQTVHIKTYVGSTPTQPTNPVVTVSLDGGATYEAPDNAAVTRLYGIGLTISADESSAANTAGFDYVCVKVESDNCDLVVAEYYFEDNWTAALAARLGLAYQGTWTVSSASLEGGTPDRCIIHVSETVPGTLHALKGATLLWKTGVNVNTGPYRVNDSSAVKGSKIFYIYPIPPTLPVNGETFELYAVVNEEFDPLTTADIPNMDLDGYARVRVWQPMPVWSRYGQVDETVQWACFLNLSGPLPSAAPELDASAHLALHRIRSGTDTVIGTDIALTALDEGTNGPFGYYATAVLSSADWTEGDLYYFEPHAVGWILPGESGFYPFREHATPNIYGFSGAVLPASPAIGPGVGENTVTITVTDSETALPLSGAVVHVRATTGGEDLVAQETDTNGQTVVNLNAATLKFQVQINGYNHDEESVVVTSGPTQAVALEATPITPTAAADPDAIRVFIYPRDVAGTIDTDTSPPLFTARLNKPCYTSDSLIADMEKVATKHVEGYWYVDLLGIDTLTLVRGAADEEPIYIFTLRDGTVLRRAVETTDPDPVNLLALD